MIKVCSICKKKFTTSKEGASICPSCQRDIYYDLLEQRSIKNNKKKNNDI